MNCPSCGKEMESGWMIPYKNCFLEWAPGRWLIQIPFFPRKGRVALRSPEPRDTAFDFPEYPASICQSCKTVLFQYQ